MTIICKVYRKASKSFVSSRQCRSLKLGGGEIVVEARDMAVAPESYDVFGSCHFHFVRGKIVASRRIWWIGESVDGLLSIVWFYTLILGGRGCGECLWWGDDGIWVWGLRRGARFGAFFWRTGLTCSRIDGVGLKNRSTGYQTCVDYFNWGEWRWLSTYQGRRMTLDWERGLSLEYKPPANSWSLPILHVMLDLA